MPFAAIVCLVALTAPSIEVEVRDSTGALLKEDVAKIELFEDVAEKPIEEGPTQKGTYKIKAQLEENRKYNLGVRLAGHVPQAKDFVPAEIAEEGEGNVKRRVIRLQLEARWVRE